MKKLKLYEQFDLDDLSEDDIFGKIDDGEAEVGDLIEILPTLEYYIEKHNWIGMRGLIGNLYIITDIGLGGGERLTYYVTEETESWYVFRDCFKIIKRSK